MTHKHTHVHMNDVTTSIIIIIKENDQYNIMIAIFDSIHAVHVYMKKIIYPA